MMIRLVTIVAVGVLLTVATGASRIHGEDTERVTNVLGDKPQAPPAHAELRPPVTIQYQAGEDVLLRLPRDESEVILRFNRVPGTVIVPSEGVSFEEWFTRKADVVAVVEVANVRGVLSQSRDWVLSEIDSTATDVLKSNVPTSVRSGQSLTFMVSGGVPVHGATRIRAIVSSVQHMRERTTYLVFLKADETGLLHAMGPRGVYEVTGSTLKSIESGEHQTPINAQQRDVVTTRVRQASLLPSLDPKPRSGR